MAGDNAKPKILSFTPPFFLPRASIPFVSNEIKISNDFFFVRARITISISEKLTKCLTNKWANKKKKRNHRRIKCTEISFFLGDFSKRRRRILEEERGLFQFPLLFMGHNAKAMARNTAEDRVVRSVWKRRMKRNYYSNWQHELTIRRPGRRRS